MKINKVVAMASHIPLLVKTFTFSEGDVAELGCGFYSTIILKSLCGISGRKLYTYERHPKWYKWASKNAPDYHKVIKVDEWTDADIDRHWGMAFVDHDQGKLRWKEIKRLANLAEYIVIHDTNPEWDREYRFHRIWSLFKFKYDFVKYTPWTSVVSNFHSLDKFYD